MINREAGQVFASRTHRCIAQDVIALMDALKIDKAILGGFDWGARTVDAVAAVWPERCKGVVAVSGYLVTNVEAQKKPLPPAAELGWWYQYYFATERGRQGYTSGRRRRSITQNISIS